MKEVALAIPASFDKLISDANWFRLSRGFPDNITLVLLRKERAQADIAPK